MHDNLPIWHADAPADVGNLYAQDQIRGLFGRALACSGSGIVAAL
jgi:hypothetical protein